MEQEISGREKPVAPPRKRKRTRILVVDDEYLIAQDLAEVIGEAGCDVVGPASDLGDALRLIGEGRTDAAVIDLNLGAGDEGVLLADRLTAQLCPFVAFSGDDTACNRFRGRFPDAQVLGKPAPRHELRRAIALLSARVAD